MYRTGRADRAGWRSTAARAACLVAALLAMTGDALAHEILPGVTGFPALMLHPFILPEQLFCLVGIMLVAGRIRRRYFLFAVAAVILGMVGGQVVLALAPGVRQFWYAPVVLALVAGCTAAARRRHDVYSGVLICLILAGAASASIVPEGAGFVALRNAVLAHLISYMLVLVLVSLPLTRVESRWGIVLVRVAGAWLAAIAILYLAFVIQLIRTGQL